MLLFLYFFYCFIVVKLETYLSMKEVSKKIKAKRKIFIQSLLVFFIAISPFLYKIYDYLPDNPDATVSFLGFVIDNNGFPDVSTYIWFMMGKVIPLYLLIFWFLTCREWWYHIILIPIAMYAFQVFEVVFDSDDIVDTENIFWLLPICMVIIPFVYFIRIKLYDKHVHGIDLEAMEDELDELKKRQHKGDRSIKSTNIKRDDFTRTENFESKSYENESFADTLNRKFSTDNISKQFKHFQNTLKNWLV